MRHQLQGPGEGPAMPLTPVYCCLLLPRSDAAILLTVVKEDACDCVSTTLVDTVLDFFAEIRGFEGPWALSLCPDKGTRGRLDPVKAPRVHRAVME